MPSAQREELTNLLTLKEPNILLATMTTHAGQYLTFLLPEKHAEPYTLFTQRPTLLNHNSIMNALITAKRTIRADASHVIFTPPANRHRPGRYVLLYSNSIG